MRSASCCTSCSPACGRTRCRLRRASWSWNARSASPIRCGRAPQSNARRDSGPLEGAVGALLAVAAARRLTPDKLQKRLRRRHRRDRHARAAQRAAASLQLDRTARGRHPALSCRASRCRRARATGCTTRSVSSAAMRSAWPPARVLRLHHRLRDRDVDADAAHRRGARQGLERKQIGAGGLGIHARRVLRRRAVQRARARRSPPDSCSNESGRQVRADEACVPKCAPVCWLRSAARSVAAAIRNVR